MEGYCQSEKKSSIKNVIWIEKQIKLTIWCQGHRMENLGLVNIIKNSFDCSGYRIMICARQAAFPLSYLCTQIFTTRCVIFYFLTADRTPDLR